MKPAPLGKAPSFQGLAGLKAEKQACEAMM